MFQTATEAPIRANDVTHHQIVNRAFKKTYPIVILALDVGIRFCEADSNWISSLKNMPQIKYENNNSASMKTISYSFIIIVQKLVVHFLKHKLWNWVPWCWSILQINNTMSSAMPVWRGHLKQWPFIHSITKRLRKEDHVITCKPWSC